MKKNKTHRTYIFLLVFIACMAGLLTGEVFLRIQYPEGIFNQNKVSFVKDNPDAKFYGRVNTGSYFQKFGEDIYFWNYKNPLIKNRLSLTKENIAIMGDSVAQGDTGGMSEFKFSRLLNEIDKERQYINFAQGGYNIAQEFIEYDNFIKDEDFSTVIYIFFGDDIYYSTLIGGTIYVSPIVILPSEHGIRIDLTGLSILDSIFSRFYLYQFGVKQFTHFSYKHIVGGDIIDGSDEQKYFSHLKQRFYKYIDEIHKITKKRGQRFVVIISPMPSPEAAKEFQLDFKEDGNYSRKRIIEEDIYTRLKEKGIEVYSMYDYFVDEQDYFIDNCCHLNEKGHKYYADFILDILNKKR